MGKGCGSNFTAVCGEERCVTRHRMAAKGDCRKEGNLAAEQFYVVISLRLFLIDQEKFVTVKKVQSGIPARFCNRQKMVGQHASQ